MMKKSNQIILGALAAIFVFSIAFQLNVNRHLRNPEFIKEAIASISEERSVNSFNKIIVSDGIHLYFTQDSISSINIEAPEKVMSNIKTSVVHGELRVENTNQHKSRSPVKAFVTNSQLAGLKASSGAYVETVGAVKGDKLSLVFSSDTKANLEISYTSVQCKAASGSQVTFKGNTSNIEFTN